MPEQTSLITVAQLNSNIIFTKAKKTSKISGMPKLTVGFFYFFFFVLISLQGFSQTETVSRSKNKILLEGRVYYIHIVKQGETLPTLCITYSTTSKVITDENPEALEGVHEGQVLKIPESKAVPEGPKFTAPDTGKVHIVQQGQTVYSICKLYGITEDELKHANPEVKYSNIQVNQVLRIPKSAITDTIKRQTASTANYIFHKVEPKQTIFSLARLYKVSMEDIKQANLTDGEWKGLRTGDIIKIPNKQETQKIPAENKAIVLIPEVHPDNSQPVHVKDTITSYNQNSQPPFLKDTLTSAKPTKPVCNCDSISAINRIRTYNVVLMLPFGLDQIELEVQIDTMQTESEEDVRQQEALQASAFKRSSVWVEYYQGTMLALSKLKEQNISVNLSIYDSESEQSKFINSINDIMSASPDLIIAVSDSARIIKISETAKSKNIALVLPVSTDRSIIENNSNSMSFEPGDEVEANYIVELLSNHKGKNIIIIDTPDSVNQRLGLLLYTKVKNSLKPDSSLLHLIQYSENQSNFINTMVRDSIENLIVVLSKREASAGDILRSINNLTISYQVSVIGMHDWSKFTTIDISYLHHLQVQYYTPFFYIFTDPKYRPYIRDFQKVNSYFPAQSSSSGYNYGMLGFDILNYSISALKKYDKKFISCLSQFQSPNYMGPFKFRKINAEGGWENQKEILVKYTKNYEVLTELAPGLKENIQSH
jgi:LysM repeat protein